MRLPGVIVDYILWRESRGDERVLLVLMQNDAGLFQKSTSSTLMRFDLK